MDATMQVKAAVHYQPGQGVEIEMLDLEEPRAHEVRIRYVASGVCHSDLHHIQGLVPHPTPVVFGHEGAGIVEAIGPDVSGVQVGDHVLTAYIPSCGHCYYCTIGRPNLCELRDKPRYLAPADSKRAIRTFTSISSSARMPKWQRCQT
jgi:Zn-dependent alcohol dehydrogenase